MPDKFQFYYSSADVKPGKGAGEEVADPSVYKDLAGIKHWRRALSNFAESEFKWKGLTWKTVEHAYHAAKFESIDPRTFQSFALESGSELSKGTGADAQKQRKIIKLTKQQATEWDAKKGSILAALWRAKFTQHEPSRHVLLATGDAELYHRAPRGEMEHWTALEELRAELRGGGGGGAGAAAAAPTTPVPEEEEEEEEEAEAPPAPAAPRQNEVALPAGRLPPAPKVRAPLTVQQAAPVGALPPAALAAGILEPPAAGTPTTSTDQSTLRFCPTCRGYLFLQAKPQSLVRLCRKCGYSEEDTRGGLVMEIMVQERSSEAYKILVNEYTRQDPTLAHIRGPIQCPNDACTSNTNGEGRDVIPIRWDEKQLKYLYICNVCGFQWRSRD